MSKQPQFVRYKEASVVLNDVIEYSIGLRGNKEYYCLAKVITNAKKQDERKYKKAILVLPDIAEKSWHTNIIKTLKRAKELDKKKTKDTVDSSLKGSANKQLQKQITNNAKSIEAILEGQQELIKLLSKKK